MFILQLTQQLQSLDLFMSGLFVFNVSMLLLTISLEWVDCKQNKEKLVERVRHFRLRNGTIKMIVTTVYLSFVFALMSIAIA